MNWNAFKRLFHYLGRYKLRLILVMIAAVLSTLFTVLTPAVTGGITSELYDGVASGSFDWETIVWLLVTLIALYLVAQLFAILQSFSMTKLTACVIETLRGDNAAQQNQTNNIFICWPVFVPLKREDHCFNNS